VKKPPFEKGLGSERIKCYNKMRIKNKINTTTREQSLMSFRGK